MHEPLADITIRQARTVEEYHACQAAQRRAWGITEDGYVVPVATLIGAQLHGGLVLGAFLPSGEAVGLSFAFLGRLDERLCLYSQLTGVVPDYQSHGVGGRLKQAQWDYARAQGLELLAWAFDPLQAGNAHFNIERLGATAGRFVENMYGPRTDALNAGTPTDRLIAEWETRRRERVALSDDVIAGLPQVITTTVAAGGRRRVEAAGAGLDAPRLLLEMPEDINRLRRQDASLAEHWQQAARAGFTACFAAGYRATGFVRRDAPGGRRCYYLLEQSAISQTSDEC